MEGLGRALWAVRKDEAETHVRKVERVCGEVNLALSTSIVQSVMYQDNAVGRMSSIIWGEVGAYTQRGKSLS